MNLPLRVFSFALALLILPLASGSDVYRWVDSKGNVHYDDKASANPAAKKVPVHSPLADPSSVADLQIDRHGDSSDVYVSNRLAGPVEIELSLSNANNVQTDPELPLRQVLGANERALVSRIGAGRVDQPSSFVVGLMAIPGDPQTIARDVVYSLPVDENSDWQLGQTFHGGFSHTDEQNLYAVDIVVDEGTPILAARGGTVMQVENGFDSSGLNREKYAERANLIRILHDDGSMAIYAHLRERGAMVRVGQKVSLGQLIGYSGNTGYSSGPHLHFCIQVNSAGRLISIPFRMVGPNGFLALPGH
jgi:murein DD-endopeptidase MepM/ murein hydrolase activator NlpD